MKLYHCYFSRTTDGVSEFVVIEGDDDGDARVKASKMLDASRTYRSVEIFDGARSMGTIDRSPAASPQADL